jgi:tetratricopeptide (TPR) repeat protein
MAPKDAGLWDRAGWCKQHLIDLDGAWKAYERAYSIEKNPWYRKGLANVLANYPLQQDEARRHFEGVLEDLKYSSDPEATQERPAGNSSTLGLLGWCHYRLGRWAEAIRLFQIALEVSPDIHPLWFDLSLAFLASGRGVLAKDVYDRGCSKTEATEEPRRRGVYYIALFDLAEFARAAKTSLPAEAAEIFDGLRGRLEASGQDLTKLFWLPQTVAVAPPIGRAETLEQISADARSSGGQNRRLIFREMLRAASVRFRNDDWYRDLVLLADRDEWPVWAVQCLTYPDRMDGALVLWRPLADLLGQVHVQASRVLCQGEVCLFDAFPEALESAIATVRERLDERRMAFPYASDRGCTVDAVELLCEIGGEILGIVTSDVARELVDFQTRQLAGKGLLRTAVSS